jgi:hypothetical protein
MKPPRKLGVHFFRDRSSKKSYAIKIHYASSTIRCWLDYALFNSPPKINTMFYSKITIGTVISCPQAAVAEAN